MSLSLLSFSLLLTLLLPLLTLLLLPTSSSSPLFVSFCYWLQIEKQWGICFEGRRPRKLHKSIVYLELARQVCQANAWPHTATPTYTPTHTQTPPIHTHTSSEFAALHLRWFCRLLLAWLPLSSPLPASASASSAALLIFPDAGQTRRRLGHP